ncbi:MAG: Nudix family hydrolase [Burkholderiales bacterium]
MSSLERSDGSHVEVAVAIITRLDGTVLLAQRPEGKVYSGYWEFPGGKVEAGEPVADALSRELHEELGIDVQRAYPWITRVYTYPHATVRLHFYRVVEWNGTPRCKEHQAITWQHTAALTVTPLLPANSPVLRALMLPAEYAISCVSDMGEARFLESLQRRLAGGLRLVQVREKALQRAALARLVERMVAAARPYNARVLVNGDPDVARTAGADGVHLTEEQLTTLESRPSFDLVGASCHGSEGLRRAEALEIDFAVLGPVKATPTHPGGTLLGWNGFGEIAANAAIPIFGIGGLTGADFDVAWSHGAHGLAMIRGSWDD